MVIFYMKNESGCHPLSDDDVKRLQLFEVEETGKYDEKITRFRESIRELIRKDIGCNNKIIAM